MKLKIKPQTPKEEPQDAGRKADESTGGTSPTKSGFKLKIRKAATEEKTTSGTESQTETVTESGSPNPGIERTQGKIKFPNGKSVTLPDKEEQPNMYALKKPEHSGSSSRKLQLGKLAPGAKTNSTPKTSRDALYGTGLTKSLLQRENKAAKKLTLGSKSNLEDLEIQKGQTTPTIGSTSFEVGKLPNQLVADDLQLDPYQTEAVHGLSNQMYGVLIGAAGTGKTTTLKFIIKDIENQVQQLDTKSLATSHENDKSSMLPAIAFCSFTGKAVQQMKKALPKKYHPLANTIHATLGYMPVEEEYYNEDEEEYKTRRVFRPTFTAQNKLSFKIVIVDETGTVPVNLWHELLDALPEDCRIFLIGDLNQLPPVTGHSILGFAMLRWPTYALEKLHRQAEGDPIAENAHRILQSKKPLTDEESQRFIVKKIPDGSKDARKLVLGAIRHLHKQGIFDPMQDALIVPQNISNLGQTELNQVLVQYFNPTIKDENGEFVNRRTIITAGYIHVTFAVGDKVMLLANDNQRKLTNGMTGVVTEIKPNPLFKGENAVNEAMQDLGTLDLSDMEEEINSYADDGAEEVESESERAASHIMKVQFQNVEEPINFETAGAFKNVALAYAMTCHKAQGSEYRNVVVVAHASNLKMMTREWLYTAITRAKDRVILLCNDRGLTHAIKTQRIKGNTIEEKAKKFLQLQKREKGEKEVRLPEPRKITDLKVEFK